MRRLIVTLAFVFVSMTSPAHLVAAAQTFDLRSAIQYSLAHSPILNSAKRQLEIREMEERSSFAAFLPSLDFSATHGLQKDSPSTRETPWTSELSLGLAETLYDNGVSITKYNTAKLRRTIAELSYRNQRDKLCRDVATEFNKFSLATKLLNSQKAQYKLLKKQYDLVSNQYRQGLKTRKDFVRFKTEVNRADLDLAAAETNIAKSEAELRRILALSGATHDEATFLPENLTLVTPLSLSKAPSINTHYETRIANLEREINALDVDIVRKKFTPELLLNSGITYSNSNYIRGTNPSFSANDRLSWNVLLTLKYNMLDFGTRHRDAAIAEAKASIAGLDLDTKILELGAEISKLMVDLRRIQGSLGLSESLLKLEQDNYRLLENEYYNGKISYLDLITGLKDLANAQVRFFTSVYELKQSLFSYRYHEGTLYDSLFKE